MSIVANKIKGIRAALCRSDFDAKRSREHNDANVLCLAGEKAEVNSALDIVKVFLSSIFESGRHLRRLEKVRAIEAKYLDNT